MSKQPPVNRRSFLKSAAVTGAAALTGGVAPPAAQAPQAGASRPASAPSLPKESDPTGEIDVLTTDRPGGDFMVDVLKALNFEYVAANPGSSFRGIHESLINYRGNTAT